MVKTEFSKVNNLFLPYPKNFDDESEELISFYKKLYSIIPDSIRQFIIVNNESAGIEIKTLYPNKNIGIILIKDFKATGFKEVK